MAAVLALPWALFLLLLAAPVAPRGGPDPGDIDGMAALLVSKMTQKEKLSLVGGVPSAFTYTGIVPGVPRLQIPPLYMNDGPLGFRCNNYPGSTTAFPSGLNIAASWDHAVAGALGRAMGREFRSKGANVQLGPGLNVARVPQCGRNFEYLSGEDPYLGATLVREVVTGIQSQAVIATAKHYVLNSQESDRGEVVSAAAERARWEIYYPPFAAAVEAGVGSVMCSYNRVDTGGGEGAQPSYACENDQTLLLDLKQGMGFKGWVMSDWGGTHSTAPAALAGLDQEMPVASFFGAPLAKAVAAGEVPAWRVDDMARRVLRAMLATGAMSWAPNATDFSANATCADHDAVARAAAAAGTVLLKNAPPGPSEVPVLPLGRGVKSIAMVGDACHEKPVVTGHGSAEVPAARLVTPLEGARAQAAARGIAVAYVSSKDPKAPLLAAAADVAVVCAGTTSGEGVDRSTLALSPARAEPPQRTRPPSRGIATLSP
mmetsp:Transcript_41802/g.133381  ORF Transcript_41802/g.133381 Transcript_41802/m.133381 type:complete len:487 (+) Transcript_41802:195-1655(+)